MKDDFFLPYQKRWILDKSRIKIMEKSRQIGMSWTCAYTLVRDHCLASQKLDSWVSSRDEMQAKLFIDDCKKFADIFNISIRQSEIGALCEKDGNSKILSFANGTSINSLSSNADAQAGKRGTRVLDEFALHPDPQRLYAIAYPGITWGGRMEIISTHRGRENFFNTLVEEAKHGENPKKISLHRVTLQDALEEGFLRKLKKNMPPENPVFEMDEAAYFDFIKNSCADNESFLQEYMCEPFDDKSSFLSYESIVKSLYDTDCKWQEIGNGSLFLGVDIGRSKDLSVFWLLEKSADTLFTREVKTFENTSFSEQEAVLYGYLKNPRFRRAAIDQSGIGRQFAERAQERFGASRVEGINFTASAKEELAYPLRAKFEDLRIRIPDTPEIRADLRSVKRETTGLGGVRFCAERSSNGHADRFWALALAAYASKEGENAIKLIPKRERQMMW